MMKRLLLATLATIAACALPAQAQEWPTKPVRVIVPFAAGGSTDVAARLIGEYLTRALGQQVFIDNRTGANGNIGIEAAAKAEADGYTILVAPASIVGNPHVYKVNYDALKDFAPIIHLTSQPMVFAAHPSLGAKTLADVVAKAKQTPDMRYALGSGVGSAQHMVGEWFARLAGIKLQQVAYRGGGQAINDLVAGHVQLGSLGSTPLIPHYRAGKLFLLAQTTAKRSKSLADVPTFEEAGYKGLVLDQWLGAFAPAGTPAAIVARLNTEIGKALADPAIVSNFEKAGLDPVGGKADDFARFARDEFEKYGRLTKELDIKVN